MVFSCITDWLFMSLWECPRDKQQPVPTDKPWVGNHPCGDSAWARASATTPGPEHTQAGLAPGGVAQIGNRSHALLLNVNVLLIVEHQSPVWQFPDFHDGIHPDPLIHACFDPLLCYSLPLYFPDLKVNVLVLLEASGQEIDAEGSSSSPSDNDGSVIWLLIF